MLAALISVTIFAALVNVLPPCVVVVDKVTVVPSIIIFLPVKFVPVAKLTNIFVVPTTEGFTAFEFDTKFIAMAPAYICPVLDFLLSKSSWLSAQVSTFCPDLDT